jgi:phosphoglycerate dehydrogenase-like enzyme
VKNIAQLHQKNLKKGLANTPEIKDKIEYLVDWDEDHYLSSMKEADVLLGWQFPTKNIREIAPNLKWIHVTSAGVNHLSPFDWMKNNLILTNSSGVHSKKAGEFGLMSILMLQNQMTKIVTNQKNKEFVTLLSKPIDGFKVVVVGTGSLGGSMIKHVSKLGAEVIGVNRKGNDVEGCSKVITFDKLDEVLPSADFLYLAVPETEETKGLINKTRLDSLKSTCGIVNIGRHSVLDYKTLRIKLEKNEIAGAILDVFSHEPIPKDSYLWDTPNLIITPHISSDSQGNYIEMVLKIFFKNLKLFLEKKELINQIDRKLGY